MWPLDSAWHLSYWWAPLGQLSVWSSSHFHVLAPSSATASLFTRFAQFPPFWGLVQSYPLSLGSVTSWVISSLTLCSQKMGPRIFWGSSFFAWNQLFKTVFCQVSIALGPSNVCSFLFLRIGTVPAPFHLLGKPSFLYYISQNFHLLFATQDWCPSVHILQSYWPLI